MRRRRSNIVLVGRESFRTNWPSKIFIFVFGERSGVTPAPVSMYELTPHKYSTVVHKIFCFSYFDVDLSLLRSWRPVRAHPSQRVTPSHVRQWLSNKKNISKQFVELHVQDRRVMMRNEKGWEMLKLQKLCLRFTNTAVCIFIYAY